MNNSFTLEVCVDSIESAIAAENGGADRLELCSALDLGGLTPSIGLVAIVKQKITIPVFMMIRPRSGGFVYSEEDVQTMIKDIEMGSFLGVDGFVTGALTSDHMVDKPLCLELIRAARGKPVTFHRAFDLMTCDVESALTDIISLGFSRILTSGRAKSAYHGMYIIKELIENVGTQITIMPGCGINDQNIIAIVKETEAIEYHSSGRFKTPETPNETPVVEGTEFYKSVDPYAVEFGEAQLLSSSSDVFNNIRIFCIAESNF
ncbi:hypothetical protein JTE90_017216 [Oedothorax gibbosus]|uniref:Copper homeostasis protein cutC homolog n=1 Tax=Oedothorax gibbosus TaxID=931172 RepID=A0AAV6VDZ3_9ARAC|nr:hypothetical protein JTE90_017216 [Oedothorax gibbosus]